MGLSKRGSERRKWERLPLAIPVFVRGLEPNGREFIEFATALDISCGGALLAIQRFLPEGSKIMIEIPSSPVHRIKRLSGAKQSMNAKLVRVTNGDHCHLLGLKFQKPLLGSKTPAKAKRKASSTV